MKYEITQGQYTEFLNSLGRSQATRRYPVEGAGKFRFTTAFDLEERYVTPTPTRACNWLNWEDGIAFADWAALRPMTELEFEKACRGKGPSVPGEYAWGTTKIISITSFRGKDGSGTETALPENANTLYLKTIMGPVRVGIFEGNKTRELAGSSYYGVPDLSGNIIEMSVTLGNSAGRQSTGKHGDGELARNGDAHVSLWPRVGASPLVAATRIEDGGFGYRGGDFYNPEADLRVSDRHVAAFHSGRRLFGLGFRAVRSDF
jgi:formylglycine-generating enzyme required for sulfatase activity